jgi:transcriptional regulator of acetoin/glycerol metabolism
MNTVAQLRADPSTADVSHDVSHEERIELVADGGSESFQLEAIDDSWRRCLHDFHVNPKSSSVPHLLTERELRISREPCIAFYSRPKKR